MVNFLKSLLPCLAGILLLAALTGCGSNSSTPIATTIPLFATIFYAHNLVERDGTTLSTGYNGFGQLGDGTLVSRAIPGTIVFNNPYSGFATGGVHSVAFLNDGTVRSWGFNAFGQLGNATVTYSSVPVTTVGLSGVKAVAAGAYHSLALSNDDTLWSWGRNDNGQLGVDTTPFGYSTVPNKIGGAGLIFSNISSIAANANHSLALADGKVWAWGLNTSGQLGVDAQTPARVAPETVAGLPAVGIAAIAAGGAFSYAVAKDGTLWAWGYNNNGQLGNNSIINSFTPVQVLKAGGSPLQNVIKTAAGVQHGLALLTDGTVWAWGFNRFGQLGNNITLDSPVAVQVVGIDGATEIRAFGSSSMAKVGNAWYAWGDNAFGQLGLGIIGAVHLPQKMVGF